MVGCALKDMISWAGIRSSTQPECNELYMLGLQAVCCSSPVRGHLRSLLHVTALLHVAAAAAAAAAAALQ